MQKNRQFSHSTLASSVCRNGLKRATQQTFTCSKLTTETVEKGVEYVQS